MYKVAIVGRPNVGKSTLFNTMTRSRRALVGDQPGMTRDRILSTVEWEDRRFQIVDTGGIVPDDGADLPEKVLEQAAIAIDDADLILLVVDGRAGLTPLDREVYRYLQSRHCKPWVVANKIDVEALEAESLQFYELGAERVFAASAEHRRGIADLLDAVVEAVPASEAAADPDEIRVAVIGRPNVGKSSLVNKLLGTERVIVSDVAGTTRDSVDSVLQADGRSYRLIDTAGIRRKGRTSEVAEKLSVVMARRHIEQSDVVLLLIDAVEGATKLDATIGGYAEDAGKSVIVVVNKWDLVAKDTHTAHQREEEYRRQMRYLDHAPFMFVSAKTSQRVFKLLDVVREAQRCRMTRIPTPELNRFLQKEVGRVMASGRKKFPLKFACQVSVAPPTFVFFLRGSSKLHFSRVRLAINRLREHYPFFATPIRILQRPAARRRG